MTWLIAFLVVIVLLAIAWVSLDRRQRRRPSEADRRRTAEDRLSAREHRAVRRRERDDVKEEGR